ncbi:MAG TPA: hypothetical protein VF229_02205 [Burkholderiaceae bacterium]
MNSRGVPVQVWFTMEVQSGAAFHFKPHREIFMADQNLSSRVTFLRIVSLSAMLTPVLLIVAAFAASSDTAGRAQIIVPGMQWTVIGLGAALAVRALYLLAARDSEDRSAAPGLAGHAIAA